MKIDTTTYEAYPGVTKRVAEILELLSRLWYDDSGPAHIVVADFNLEDHHLLWCIEVCRKGDRGGNTFSDYPPGHPVMRATAELLLCLAEIPEAERLVRDSA